MLLGIDFGTTKSVVAAVQAGRPKVIPDVYDHYSMPSVVLVAPDQSLHVGWDAVTHPHRYAGTHFSINSIKRMMGKAGEATWGALRTYPQEVSALILAALKIQAETYLQQSITGAVIAVPAHFDINQRWATMQAAEIAGLRATRLVNEATAAMMAWVDATRRGGPGVGLVFDFGGGTLDVSIVEYGEGVYEVKATAGDGRLGGDDFDQVIVDHCLRVVTDRIPDTPELTPTQQLLLRESAKRAKEDLSSTSRADIHLAGFIQDRTRYQDLDMSLKRSEFEALCAPLLARVKATIQRALDDTKGTCLDHVLLIGGMSRVPCVQALVKQATGLTPMTSADPLVCVAQGASLYAGIMDGSVRDIVLLDVMPEAYGVATKGGRVVPMIPRNATIPTRVTKAFTTTEDNQADLIVEVVREEGDRGNQTSCLGAVHLSGIPPAKAGVPEIEVSFDIGGDHSISVSARDMATGREVAAALQSPYRLNPAQVRVLQAKVSREMARVRERFLTVCENALDVRAQDDAQATIRGVEEVIGESTCPLAPDQVSLLSAGVALLRDYLHRNVPREELDKLAASIRQALEKEGLRCVERALRAIADTPEYAQWAEQIQHVWHDPAQMAASLVNLRGSLRESADRFRVVLQFGGLPSGRAWLKASMAALRASSGALFCLACLLDDSMDPQFDTLGLIDVRDADRPLLVTVILRDLATAASPARRRAAASTLLQLWNGTRCFLLLQYLIDERDPDVATWLTRCLGEIPQGDWVEFILAQGGEKRQAVLGSAALLNLVQQDVLRLLQSGQAAQGEAAVRVIRELHLADRLPELPGLLQANLADTVTISILKLLSASPREGLCVPILQCLARTSPEVRYAAVMALEGMRHMMDKDCERLVTIAVKLMDRPGYLNLQDKLFLWSLGKRRGEFRGVAQALRTNWRGAARR